MQTTPTPQERQPAEDTPGFAYFTRPQRAPRPLPKATSEARTEASSPLDVMYEYYAA